MSTTTIHIPPFTSGGVLYDPTSVKLSNTAGTAGVIRNDTGATVVADNTATTKVSTGIYTYDVTDPAADLVYTAYIEYVVGTETYRFPMTVTGTTSGASLEPTNSKNFATLKLRLIGRHTGMTDATAGQLINDAYEDAVDAHTWRFLTPTATLTMTSAVATTALPADFGGMVERPTYAAGTGRYMREEWTPARIRQAQEGPGAITDYPYAFAIEPVAFDTATGQRYQVRWNYTPSTTCTMTYRYRRLVNAMVNDGDYPMGGPQFNRLILDMASALWEAQKGEAGGVWAARADKSLATAIQADFTFGGGLAVANISDHLHVTTTHDILKHATVTETAEP